jgi:hypothetical protein
MRNRLRNRWLISPILPVALLLTMPGQGSAQESATPVAAPAAEPTGAVEAGATGGSAEVPSTTVIYEREVFEYSAGGRPDPFRSLLQDGELGIRIEDLMLRGVVYHPDPARSVAVLSQTGSQRRIQARVGERVGTLRILSIQPERVEVVVEELGVARRETLTIVRPEPGATQ